MSKINVNVDLIKAVWCGHCQRLMPEWEIFRALTKTTDKVNFNINVYESTTQQDEIDALIKEKKYQFGGYPSIYITVDNKESIAYDGERTGENIFNTIMRLIEQPKPKRLIEPSKPKKQRGGKKNDEYYEKKYYKYKAKYLQTKI